MDKKTLVNIDIEEGKKVINLLDNSGMKILSAFWLFYPRYRSGDLCLPLLILINTEGGKRMKNSRAVKSKQRAH